MRAVSLGAALAIVLVSRGDACSTIVAGPKATKDGSTMASHSNDGGGSTDGRCEAVRAPLGRRAEVHWQAVHWPQLL